MRTYAFDVRHRDANTLLAVALVTPAARSLSVLADGRNEAEEATLSNELWDEIGVWASDGDLHLPAQPPPLSGRLISALLTRSDASALIARRFAALAVPHLATDPTLRAKTLAGLLSVRRSAA